MPARKLSGIPYSDYYIGLDVGVSSAGWAVTDLLYRLLRCKGKDMWGVRLFPEAKTAVERRTARSARRRLARRKQRLDILEMLFAPALNEKDPQFLVRMHESDLWQEDKSGSSKYSLFADENFTDRDYHKAYPTAYHLRSELAHSTEPHDVRLVFLALHHLMKSRGHFLYEMSDTSSNGSSLESKFDEFCAFLSDTYDLDIVLSDKDEYLNVLKARHMGLTAKAQALNAGLKKPGKNEEGLSQFYISELLAGKKVKLKNLFGDAQLKDVSVSMQDDLDAHYDELSEALEEHISVIVSAKEVYDAARLAEIIGSHQFLCDAKIAAYDQNHIDLKTLKRYVQKHYPTLYKEIFCAKKDKLNNYAAYSRYHHASGDYACSQAAFCEFLKKVLPDLKTEEDPALSTIYQQICDGSFLPRLRNYENGVIPYQLQMREVDAILTNASSYLPFLSQKENDGFTPAEKIKKTFAFRVPYYVGPLSDNASHHWAVRTDEGKKERIYPWNFDRLIDLNRSSEAFLVNLVGRCTYTGDLVLPKDSLLYSEFTLLNELNPLKVEGEPLPIGQKKQLINDMFLHPAPGQKGKVTKRKLLAYMQANGWLSKKVDADAITGIDDHIKSDLRSHKDFADILTRTGDRELVEDIIRHILVFGDDKKMLRHWLRTHTDVLTEGDIKKISRLRYTDWGRLSKTFLTGIYTAGEYGEAKNIMDMLRDTNDNLMQLLSDKYEFAAHADAYRNENFGNNETLSDKLDELYISPAVRRSIRQALRIVDEIVKLRKAAPAKIFVEVARDSSQKLKGKRTESRKDKLLELYKACKKDSQLLAQMCISDAEMKDLTKHLESEEESHLRSERLYLYYTQFGRCMYSGEPMDLASVMRGERYDRDHIFPRSRIKDDSLSNLVLVKNELNREKKNTYPIDDNIRQRMIPFWKLLKDKGLISEKKYSRLVRSTPLTTEELSDFIARQLVQTQQSTKALTALLKDRYGDNTRIVFSKAGNVSEFRQEFDMVKCREVNDLHHAKDAYLNIVVGNVYDTRFTEQFFKNIQNEKYSVKAETLFKKMDTPDAWNKEETIKTVQRYMKKNSVIVTHMPYERTGLLFDMQPLVAGKGQIKRKSNFDIAKYGGYSSQNIAYCFVVEFTNGKKRVRAFRPVFLYQKHLYESDPIQYCESILQLENPKIIYPKILIDSLLEFDGKRVLLSGYSATDSRLSLKIAQQLFVNAECEKYIKRLLKFVGRHASTGKTTKAIPHLTKFDGITLEQNLKLYDWLTEKGNSKIYPAPLQKMSYCLAVGYPIFEEMSILKQCKLLLDILHAFQCNPVYPNLKSIGGSSEASRYRTSANLQETQSIWLISQSVTGLYEHKIDLLK